MTQEKQRKSGSKRWMNLPLFVLYGLSMSVGAAIYVIIGTAAGYDGAYSPFSFILPASTAGLTAFSYAEFATRHPLAGGEASYVGEAFGFQPLSTAVGFLFIAIAVTSAAYLAVGAAAYSKSLIPFLPTKVILGGVITLITTAALAGVYRSSAAIFIIGIAAISGIALTIFYGFQASPPLLSNMDRLLPPFEWTAWQGILFGSFVSLLPFVGLVQTTNLPDKIKTAKRTVPVGLFITLLLSLCMFVILAVFLVLIAPLNKLSGSIAPLTFIFDTTSFVTQKSLISLTLVVIISGAALQVYLASKVVFNLALMGRLPHFLAAMNKLTKTAHIAILALMGFIGTFAYTLSLTSLAQVTSALILVLFIITNAALIRLKWSGTEIPNFNAFSTYMWVPIAGLITCATLLGIGIWATFLV